MWTYFLHPVSRWPAILDEWKCMFHLRQRRKQPLLASNSWKSIHFGVRFALKVPMPCHVFLRITSRSGMDNKDIQYGNSQRAWWLPHLLSRETQTLEVLKNDNVRSRTCTPSTIRCQGFRPQSVGACLSTQTRLISPGLMLQIMQCSSTTTSLILPLITTRVQMTLMGTPLTFRSTTGLGMLTISQGLFLGIDADGKKLWTYKAKLLMHQVLWKTSWQGSM
jgi:hypothetical protein